MEWQILLENKTAATFILRPFNGTVLQFLLFYNHVETILFFIQDDPLLETCIGQYLQEHTAEEFNFDNIDEIKSMFHGLLEDQVHHTQITTSADTEQTQNTSATHTASYEPSDLAISGASHIATTTQFS